MNIFRECWRELTGQAELDRAAESERRRDHYIARFNEAAANGWKWRDTQPSRNGRHGGPGSHQSHGFDALSILDTRCPTCALDLAADPGRYEQIDTLR